ncbi:hypothetical protein HDV04_003856 [Boothiomyces sp. JEL0838]|nr:hypothetical protein HDV04_003856 [Boothiomyces sp. JEL0838]
MIYRQAIEQDAQEVVDFLKQTTLDTFNQDFTIEELNGFVSAFTPTLGLSWIKDGFVYLASTDKIVGIVVASKFNDTSGEIKKLYITKDFHGKGVAKHLLDKAIEWINAKFPSPIYIEVYSGNDRAVAFYKKHGFEIVDKAPSQIESSINFIMKK